MAGSAIFPFMFPRFTSSFHSRVPPSCLVFFGRPNSFRQTFLRATAIRALTEHSVPRGISGGSSRGNSRSPSPGSQWKFLRQKFNSGPMNIYPGDRTDRSRIGTVTGEDVVSERTFYSGLSLRVLRYVLRPPATPSRGLLPINMHYRRRGRQKEREAGRGTVM